jgi:hypothetical protein
MHPRWWHETKDYSCVIEAAGSKIWTTHIDQRGIETEVYFTDGKEHIASPLYKKTKCKPRRIGTAISWWSRSVEKREGWEAVSGRVAMNYRETESSFRSRDIS